MSDAPNRGYHDMGGLPAGPVERVEHAAYHWEKQIDAMLRLLASPDRQVMRIDELRRGIEELTPELYDGLSYYEKWIAALTNILVEKGVLQEAEIEQRRVALRSRGGPS